MSRRTDFVGANLTPEQIETASRAMEGGLSRRRMIAYMLATSAAAGSMPALLGLDGRALAQETPKMGGKLRVAGNASSTADTLDPSQVRSSTDYVRIRMFFNTLTVMDENMSPQPELAESVTSADAITWIIKLKPDVEFHDGKTLGAADVVYSLKRHQNPDLASRAASLMAQFAEIEATGPLEVTAVLSAPNADIPALFTGHNFAIVQDGAEDFAKPVGTGPFTCETFEPGGRAVGRKFANYFKEGRPYLDEIEHFAIADDNARLNALMSGDIQLANAFKPNTAQVLEANPATGLLVTNSGNYTDLILRVDQAPGNNPDFVLGMKYLLNRQQMVDAVLRGYGELANDTPLSPSSKYYNAEIPQRAYDPEKARFHLEKAGVMGQSIEMVTADAAGQSVDMGVILQQSAQEIGFDLRINKVPSDGYWSNYWFKVPISWGNVLPRPTADILFSEFYKSDAAWNESGWNDERFDKLLLEARKEQDESLRKQMYGEMQQLIHDHCGTAIPAFQANLDGYRQELKGLKAMPIGPMMGYNFAESVWLDA